MLSHVVTHFYVPPPRYICQQASRSTIHTLTHTYTRTSVNCTITLLHITICHIALYHYNLGCLLSATCYCVVTVGQGCMESNDWSTELQCHMWVKQTYEKLYIVVLQKLCTVQLRANNMRRTTKEMLDCKC